MPRKLVGKDMNELGPLNAIGHSHTRVALTPISGQDFMLDRGNQQISPSVLRRVGQEYLIIISTRWKIQELQGRSFLIDTCDDLVDNTLKGFYTVITGYHDRVIYKVG
ncbi:MAG: NAD(+)/NADH kinase [Fidelibacterota bacterium]|nr:MAG: NAD(+)/NADH kinase [Candidatus Neomarinimicrobiota bacterium]